MTQHSQNGEGVELLPCPFCGGDAERITIEEEGDNFGGDVIQCMGMCGASSHVEFGRKENLVSLWNTRQSLAREPATADVGRDDYDTFVELEGWVREYRQSMNADVLHLWARDMVETGKKLLAIRDRVLDAALSRAAPSSGPAIAEGERLMHVIDRDRYAAAACVNAIDFVLHSRRWLREAGRGSYAYDDERYQEEFGLAFDEIMEALRPMRALAKDKTDCTTDPDKVVAARAAGAERFTALSTTSPTTNDAIPAGMVRWDGGRKPDDWSGEAVQFRSGEVMHAPPAGTVWKLGWDHCYGSGDIIAYTPKASAAPSAPATEAGEEA